MNSLPQFSLDIVIPVYNEEEILPVLFKTLNQVFSEANLERAGLTEVNYLFIDDGSKDNSANIIHKEIVRGLPATLCRFSRNFGHQNAVSAGIDASRADLVALIDADLQDPPELILEMVAKAREGFNVVYAIRKARKENVFKVFCYWAFYRFLSLLSEVPVPVDSGDFCLMDRKVVNTLLTLPEKLRFPRGLRSWIGFKQTGIEYERPERVAGSTKYSLIRLYKLATDGIASLSTRPLRITQFFTLCFLTLLFIFGVLSAAKYFNQSNPDPIALWFLLGYALISLSCFMIMLGIYIMSAYIGRTYLEVKARPSYIIMEKIERTPGLKKGYSNAFNLTQKQDENLEPTWS